MLLRVETLHLVVLFISQCSASLNVSVLVLLCYPRLRERRAVSALSLGDSDRGEERGEDVSSPPRSH